VKVIGYLRVSTQDQADSGLGLDAQRHAINLQAALRGWTEVTWLQDAASGKDTERPGLTEALTLLASGKADVLVVAKLDRLSRSLVDFADVLATARTQGWNLVVADLNLDLASPHGEFTAYILAAVAQLERRLISDRTRSALAAAQRNGVVLGRPAGDLSSATLTRVGEMSSAGHNLTEIAKKLTEDKVLLPSGRLGTWHPAQVRRVMRRAHALTESDVA
jgi:DNA invertase Pin-like site-specific DNA recombinase